MSRRAEYRDPRVMDLGELKRHEAIRNVVESAAVGVWHVDDEGRTIYLNQAMAQMLEVEDPGAMAGVPYHAFFTPETLEAMKAVERARVPGTSSRYEVRMVGRRGARRDLILSSVRLESSEGRAPGFLGAFIDITDIKQASAALSAVETRYRSLFDNATEGIYQLDASGRLILGNPALARILGFESPEGLLEAMGPSGERPYVDPGRREEFMELLRKEGRVQDFESEVRRRDGTLIWTRESARAIRDARGALLFYEGTLSDITGSKRAEGEIRQKSRQLEDTLETMTEGLVILDRDGRIVLINAAAEQVLGVDRAGMLGRNRDILPWVGKLRSAGGPLAAEDYPFERLRRGADRVSDLLVDVERPTGGRVWISLNAVALRDAEGRFEGTLSTFTDVTARLEAEGHAAQSEQVKSATVSSALDAIVSIDGQGRIIEFNPAAEQCFGYRREEVIGRPVSEVLVPPYLRKRHEEGFLRHLATGQSDLLGKRIELQAMRADGSLIDAELTITRLPLDPPVFTAFLRDVTAQRRSQLEIDRSRERLERALEATGLALFETNAATGDIFLSEGWAKMLGEAPGPTRTTVMALLDRVHPAERDTLMNAATDAMKGVTAGYDVEHRVRTRTGDWIWILSRARILERDARGRAVFIAGTNVDITERVKARESEAKFKALWDVSNDAIVLIDDDRVIRYANPAVRTVFGWVPDDLIGRGIEELQPLGRRSSHRGGLGLFFAASGNDALDGRSMETTARRRDGAEIPIELTFNQFAMQGRSMFAVFIRDITTRKQGRDLRAGQRRVLEIMSSEASLEVTLGALIDMIESLFPGMFCSVLLMDDSDKHLQHGAPDRLPAEYTAAIDGEPIGPEAGSCGTAAWRKEMVIVEDISTDPLWKKYRAAAEPHGLRACWSNPIMASNGRVLGTFAMYYKEPRRPGARELEAVRIAASLAAIAIERKRAAESLVAHARHETLLAEFGRFAIQTRELDAVMAEAAAKVCEGLDLEFCKILELPPHEDAFLLRAGHGWPEGQVGKATIGTGTTSQAGYCFETKRPVIVEDFRLERRFGMSTLNRDSGIRSGVDVIIERRGGDAFGVLSAHARKVRRYTPEDVSFMQAMANGVAAAIERHETEARLSQAQKMEAIGGLAGGIAHDFNNILGAILGYSEMIQEHAEAGSSTRKYVDIIASAGERGKQLVAQILAFSRATATEMGPVEMKLLVREVIAVVRGSLSTSVRVEERFPEAPAIAVGNATHLYQLVMNLCTNAIQAMPRGGTLRITLALEMNEARRALPGGMLSPGQFIRLDIEDEGEGMPAEMLPRIFEPFFSSRQRGRGTGLGLAIAHRIVANHGGAIDVESRVGSGSRFTVYLPENAGRADFDGKGNAKLPRGKGEAVLVVDDEPELMQLAQETLAMLGYEPVGFSSSERAWSAFAANPARFDAIVTDEVMPGLTGTELCTRVREIAAIPILLVSGYGGEELEARAKAAGAAMILKKPYLKHELASALAAVLANGR